MVVNAGIRRHTLTYMYAGTRWCPKLFFTPSLPKFAIVRIVDSRPVGNNANFIHYLTLKWPCCHLAAVFHATLKLLGLSKKRKIICGYVPIFIMLRLMFPYKGTCIFKILHVQKSSPRLHPQKSNGASLNMAKAGTCTIFTRLCVKLQMCTGMARVSSPANEMKLMGF